MYAATYVRTLDGDTVDAIVDLGFNTFKKIRIRLSVIDTPEKSESGWAEATAFTRNWFESHPEFIVRTDKDKSGGFDRYLGDCYSVDMSENINNLLLEKGLAKVYKRNR